MSTDLVTEAPTHKLPCTPEEAKKTACLNDGECFAYPGYNEVREIGCQCETDWEGRRCELVRFDPSIFLVNSSMIMGIVAALVFLLAVSVVIVFLCLRRRKRNRQRQQQQPQQDPSTEHRLMGQNGTSNNIDDTPV